MGDTKEIADKDLPDIKPADIALDTSAVDALEPAELVVVKDRWVCSSRTNEQLVLLMKQCPEKVEQLIVERDRSLPLSLALGNPPRLASDEVINEKIARLKEQYAVCLKEITSRKAKAVDAEAEKG
jgi:hypothetical protein